MTIKVTCPMCKKDYTVEMPNAAYNNWQGEGKMIQDAWPEGSATDRESLISGLCPECQEEVFK